MALSVPSVRGPVFLAVISTNVSSILCETSGLEVYPTRDDEMFGELRSATTGKNWVK